MVYVQEYNTLKHIFANTDLVSSGNAFAHENSKLVVHVASQDIDFNQEFQLT